MGNTCPLCERDSRRADWYSVMPSDSMEIQNEIANLDRTLESLQAREESIASLNENRFLMCMMCKELFNGIENESDRHELEEKVNRQIFLLESQLESSYAQHL